jgi:hypothetical protein
MASQMKVISITRKAVVHEPNATVYQLFVTKQAKVEGQEPEVTALSTKIEKVTTETVVTGGAARRPIEQYSFRVGARLVLRFADAVALVAKKHRLDLNGVLKPPTYVQEAAAMLREEKEIRFVDEDTIGQNPVAEEKDPEVADAENNHGQGMAVVDVIPTEAEAEDTDEANQLEVQLS